MFASVNLQRIGLILLVFGTTLCCDNYTVTKDSEGRTIRLNKSSGEVVVIEGDRMLVPKSKEEVEAEKKANESKLREQKEKLANRREWDQSMILKTRVTLNTIYLGSQMRFKLVFENLPEKWEESSYVTRPFTLIFLKNGIEVFSQPLNRSDFARIVDDSQKNVKYGLSYDGSIPMTPEEYEMLGGWTISWSI
jgi:hypothetical protein